MKIGLLGPTEPSGLYREAKSRMRAPSFAEVSFPVDRDINGIEIVLK